MPDAFTAIALFKSSQVSAEGEVLPLDESNAPVADQQREIAFSKAEEQFAKWLPVVHIDLTPTEDERVQAFQGARLVLGASGAAPMICSQECPFLRECPLAAVEKHPRGHLCPFEAHYIRQRFLSWTRELERTPDRLTESERSAISSLVGIDIQEMRCMQILARAENAMLQQRSVRDVNLETGEPICWEDQVHINAQRLDQLLVQRRLLLRDFELTPEAKTRRAKALGIKPGTDLSTRQSQAFDKIRAAKKAKTIDVEPKVA